MNNSIQSENNKSPIQTTHQDGFF